MDGADDGGRGALRGCAERFSDVDSSVFWMVGRNRFCGLVSGDGRKCSHGMAASEIETFFGTSRVGDAMFFASEFGHHPSIDCWGVHRLRRPLFGSLSSLRMGQLANAAFWI